MKRGLKYIIIYLTICLSIGYVTSVIDYLLMSYYSADVKEEINLLLDDNEKVLVDGGMLGLFLKNQVNDYNFKGISLDNDDDSFVSFIEDKSFYIEKEIDTYVKRYNVYVSDNHNTVSLRSVDEMNSLMIFNKIFLNALAILIGLFLVLKYNRIIVRINKGVRDE